MLLIGHLGICLFACVFALCSCVFVCSISRFLFVVGGCFVCLCDLLMFCVGWLGGLVGWLGWLVGSFVRLVGLLCCLSLGV